MKPAVVRSVRSIACSLALLGASTAGVAQNRAFDFALIGDMPYTKVQEQEYQRVITALNANDLAFVAHIGDFQMDPRGYNPNPARSSKPCVDENYRAIYASFQTFRHPLIFSPGDNDWSDCWLMQGEKLDPLALLAKIRTMFFPEGKSLGQNPIAVRQQSSEPGFSKFRENLRWTVGGVLFVTLHTVGDNDNFGRTPEMDAEHLERKAANLAWMKQAFAEARATDTLGLVILTQANPRFENSWRESVRRNYFKPVAPPAPPVALTPSQPNPASPFDDYLSALAVELETYGKPVAYLHGDTHTYRIDKPLYSRQTHRVFQNFTRVETFGWQDTHWVRISVDPFDPNLFRFKAEIVSGNTVNGEK
jgi:hypothetical protein